MADKQDVQESELIQLAGTRGFRVELFPTDESLGRFMLFYTCGRQSGWLVTWRGTRRAWANLNTVARWAKDELGQTDLKVRLDAESAVSDT